MLKNLRVNRPLYRAQGPGTISPFIINVPLSVTFLIPATRGPPVPLETGSDCHYLSLGQFQSLFWVSKANTQPKSNRQFVGMVCVLLNRFIFNNCFNNTLVIAYNLKNNHQGQSICV